MQVYSVEWADLETRCAKGIVGVWPETFFQQKKNMHKNHALTFSTCVDHISIGMQDVGAYIVGCLYIMTATINVEGVS